MNIEKSQRVIKQAIKNRLTPVLWGRHGIGKSQIVEQLARQLSGEFKKDFTNNPHYFDSDHFGFVDLRLGQMEVGDLLGMPLVNAEKEQTIWCKPKWFPATEDSKGIIFLDELNRARLDVLQAVFQLVWDRRISTHILPEGWSICVACNPSGSEYFVNEIDPALMDRFVHIKLNPEPKEWVAWARNTKSVNEMIIEFIEKHYQENLGLDGYDVNLEIKPSPRSWHVLSQMLNDLPEDLWLETAMGIVGNESAIAFHKHAKSNLERPIRANQVLGAYPKWQKKLKKYADRENVRADLLRITCDDIERELKKEYVEGKKEITKSVEENLVQFLRDLPTDLSFAMIKTLVDSKKMGTEKFNELLCRYNDIYMKLENANKLDDE
jgi:hypothetical protein